MLMIRVIIRLMIRLMMRDIISDMIGVMFRVIIRVITRLTTKKELRPSMAIHISMFHSPSPSKLVAFSVISISSMKNFLIVEADIRLTAVIKDLCVYSFIS
jgi:hypothetical protein